jgi:hypothetical protein
MRSGVAMKPITKKERKFANRILKRAVAIAARSGDVMSNQTVLWGLMVQASHKPKKGAK